MTSTPSLPAVDDLHPPATDDPWITETAWYSFWTAGAEFAVHIYLRFRPNLGIANPCIYVWGPGPSVEWDAAYWKHSHYPMPTSLRSMRLLGGLHHEALVPFQRYRISYSDHEKYGPPLAFDVEFAALDAPEFLGRKHFDQPMRVTGQLQVEGQHFEIDCRALRDRSWYSRGDYTLFRSAYSYVLPDDANALLAIFAAPRDADLLVDDLPLAGGFTAAPTSGPTGPARRGLTAGTRTVTRRDAATGHPLEVVLDLADPDGPRRLHGRVRNSMAVAANPNMLSWMSLVEWDLDGTAVLGEDQEIWSPSIWHAFRKGA